MRIVYLNSSGALGGSETCLVQMAAAMRRAYPDYRLHAVLGEEGPLVARLEQAGIGATIVPLPPELSGVGDSTMRFSGRLQRLPKLAKSLVQAAASRHAYVRKLKSAIEKLQPEIVHAMNLKMHLLGAASCPSEARLLWHVHDDVSDRPLAKLLWNRDLPKCDGVIANSAFVGRRLQASCKTANRRLSYIHNAIDSETFSPAKAFASSKADVRMSENRPLRIGMPATFARWKGHEVFLQALKLIPGHVQFEAFIIGGPIYRTSGSQYSESELKQIASSLGVAVTFTGFQSDMPAILRSLDIVVHASTKPEPFGMVLIEAMACGRALVASSAGGPLEIVRHGVDGLLVEAGNAEQLAASLVRLAEDRSFREGLGAAARAGVLERFSLPVFAAKMSSIYHCLLNAAPFPPANLLLDGRQ